MKRAKKIEHIRIEVGSLRYDVREAVAASSRLSRVLADVRGGVEPNKCRRNSRTDLAVCNRDSRASTCLSWSGLHGTLTKARFEIHTYRIGTPPRPDTAR